jgi:23S rRNA (pseudouridine1915-N3)-methyltransferase
MARQIHLIAVGKLKNKNLEEIESEYLKRIHNPSLIIHEVKAQAENPTSEGEAILKKIRELPQSGPNYIITLSEWGSRMESVPFSDWINSKLELNGNIVFIISGAEGFSEKVLQTCHFKLSLSQLTFPHKLARIILVEQVYRAQTIRTGHPYHN